MVKFVRREIRSLTDVDREKFFNAVHILARVPTEVGQKMYGAEYKSKDYFNRVHLYYGGTADCDHWHQGAGFVTSHVTLTLEYEKAIQSVFPGKHMIPRLRTHSSADSVVGPLPLQTSPFRTGISP